MNTFRNGDVVLLSGIRSPDMVVVEASAGFVGEVRCQWFDRNDCLQEARFNPERLKHLYPPKVRQVTPMPFDPFVPPMDPNTRFDVAPAFVQKDVPGELRDFESLQEIGDVAQASAQALLVKGSAHDFSR